MEVKVRHPGAPEQDVRFDERDAGSFPLWMLLEPGQDLVVHNPE